MALTQVTTRGIAKGVEIVLSGGLTGDPSISWQNDEDTGLYSSNAGFTDFTSNGTTVLSIGPDGINFPSGSDTPFKFNGSTIVTFKNNSLDVANGKQLIVPQGSVSNPSFAYNNDTDTGIFSSGDGQIDFVSNGTVKLTVDSSGLVLPTGSVGSSINITNSLRNIYVSANDTLSTDSLSNNGRNLNKPFKTIQRALLEAAKQSWVNGPGDEDGEYGADLFEFFTIVIFPGEYEIDNRPGDGSNANILIETSYTDETLMENIYRFNDENGGVIVPRGTSLVGLDLRKTICRPTYIPSPVDASAGKGAMFNVTGGCYFWQLTFKDSNRTTPFKSATATYTNSGADVFPCSHHKLTVFEYASSPALTNYYTKVDKYSLLDDIVLIGNRQGDAKSLLNLNKRFIAEVAVSRMLANFPSFSVPGGRANCEDDIEDVVEAVAFNVGYGANNKVHDAANLYVNGGALQHLVGEETESIYAFNEARNIAKQIVNNVTVTVVAGQTSLTQIKDLTITADPVTGSNTDPASCANVTSAITALFAIVTDTIATPSSLAGVTRTSPSVAPSSEDYIQRIEENRIVGSVATAGASDTVGSASPYIFNCSLRSVFGMNGLHADGSRATGFKSMVLAQYTGIALQKDNRAFVGSNLAQGTLQNNADSVEYRIDPDSVYRDDWRHFHIKASNDGFLQVVSVFAVGNADHFLAESGGDMSITNSNSNFGNCALKAVSHRPNAFAQDSGGFVVGLIPPRGINPDSDTLISVTELDVGHTVTAYEAARAAGVENLFKKIYIKVGGRSEIAEKDIPEFYDTDSSGNVTKAELLVSGLDYNLGKRKYSDNLPEALYAFLPATPADATSKLFGARLRARDTSNLGTHKDPSNTYGEINSNGSATGTTITTKNNVRSFYGWEYTRNDANGVQLGRVCLLVNDGRQDGSINATGIPVGFDNITLNGVTYADGGNLVNAVVDALPSNSAGTPLTGAELGDRSALIKVKVNTNGSGEVTGISVFDSGNQLVNGSGFSNNDFLILVDGAGTSLGVRSGAGPVVFQVNTVTSVTSGTFSSENIKPFNFIPFSSVGSRYGALTKDNNGNDTALNNESPNNLALLRRLTQRRDSNGDNQTSTQDDYEFSEGTTANVYIKRLQDNRSGFGNGEFLWRILYKMPKGTAGSQELKAPEPKFTLQLRDANAKYPFTYTSTNAYPRAFYIYDVEPLIEYQHTVRDGYYQLTVLDGNVFERNDGTQYGNTITYGQQTTSGTSYTITDTTVTGLGVSQNINYLYPEIDLDNPDWNPRPSVSRYRDDVGNTIPRDNNLTTHGYDRITQYSITSEATLKLLNEVLAGGTISANLTNELVLTNIFPNNSTMTEAAMIAPYGAAAGSASSKDIYGVNKGVVSEFIDDIPQFTDRVIKLDSNIEDNNTAGIPINLHRPSILRASGHTWEYVGFGPGNYSTGLPRFQTKVLSLQKQVNAQQIEGAGGFVASSGTNSNGDFFIGNQVIDTKGNKSSTLNFPKVKTSADNKLIDFGDVGSLSSNSSASAFNPSSFSATLTESLATLQQAQQNSFKTANLEATTATIGTLNVDSKIEISKTIFQDATKFPQATNTDYGFVKRAQEQWFELGTGSADFQNQKNNFISPVDLEDWATKNAFITTKPEAWPLGLSAIPASNVYNEANNAGEVTDEETLKLTSNFQFTPVGSITDNRWYDNNTTVTNIVLGNITNLADFNGRSGQIYVTYPQQVKVGSIHPSAIWTPVSLNWRGLDENDGTPVAYLTGTVFLITYYINEGKIIYVTNVVS